MDRNILFEDDGSFDPEKLKSRVGSEVYSFLVPLICWLELDK